ncbi:hypothetical protein [Lysobacter gummosus]
MRAMGRGLCAAHGPDRSVSFLTQSRSDQRDLTHRPCNPRQDSTT